MQPFSKRLIKWHKKNGRNFLPWQKNKSPYRVWVSEIMLQQTQVETVIPFFNAFIKEFPDVDKLAKAKLDKVMSCWSGMGYYARARNIHKAAKIVRKKYNSKLPETINELTDLPGIGLSTAGAIISLGFNKKAAILDANVKRIITRHKQIQEDITKSSTEKNLWKISNSLLPSKEHISVYNQALMDLGALVCSKSSPKCHICPLNADCLARKHGLSKLLPIKNIKKKKPLKEVFWLIVINKRGKILLQKRKESGIWGGLWTFIELENKQKMNRFCFEQFNQNINKLKAYEKINHKFSHYNLRARPFFLKLSSDIEYNAKELGEAWLGVNDLDSIGTPAPVKELFKKIYSYDKNS